MDTRGTLSELLPAFQEIDDCNPMLIGELQIQVKMFITHICLDESEESITLSPTDCEVSIGTMNEEMEAQLEKFNPLVTKQGLQAVYPYIRIEDIIEAFHVDVNAPAWELYYQ